MTESKPLIFVALDDIGTRDTKKQVRSSAAHHSHKFGPRKPKGQNRPRPRREEASATTASSKTSQQQVVFQAPFFQQPYSLQYVRGAVNVSANDIARWLVLSPLQLTHSLTNATLTDPFETSPVPAEPWFPRTLHYMWQFVVRADETWDAAPAELEKCHIWLRGLFWSEPSFFYVNLLAAAEDLARNGLIDASVPLWVKGKLVEAIQAGLNQASQTPSVGLILSVGRIAFHEIMLGDRVIGETIHRPAFVKMMTMAGGLDALPIPPRAKEMVLWADRLMARVTGVTMTQMSPGVSVAPGEFRIRDIKEDISLFKAYHRKAAARLRGTIGSAEDDHSM